METALFKHHSKEAKNYEVWRMFQSPKPSEIEKITFVVSIFPHQKSLVLAQVVRKSTKQAAEGPKALLEGRCFRRRFE